MFASVPDPGSGLHQDWAAATAVERATLLLLVAESFTRRLRAIASPSLWLIHDANQMTYSAVTAVRSLTASVALPTEAQLEALAGLETSTLQEILLAWLSDVAHAGSAPAQDALYWANQVADRPESLRHGGYPTSPVFGFASPLNQFRPHAA